MVLCMHSIIVERTQNSKYLEHLTLIPQRLCIDMSPLLIALDDDKRVRSTAMA
jgi:hypothetical protein